MASFIIGLTGGIGAGKTTAASRLSELGACVIDADEVARGVGQQEIKAAFSDCVEAGRLNRRLLREKAFNDAETLKKLNAISHPLIKAEIDRLLEESRGVVVLVAPLLFETGLNERCDFILNISTSDDTRIKRLTARDNIGVELARAVIAAQTSEEIRRAGADLTLENDGEPASLRLELDNFWKRIVEKRD